MAGESAAFPVTDDTTALYYFQGAAETAVVDSGPNNYDLILLNPSPLYELDGYYADAAIDADDDGIDCTSGNAALYNPNNADTVFPDTGWQLEILFQVNVFTFRFSIAAWSVYLDSTNYVRILNDSSNRRLQLDWETGGTRSIIRDATADSGYDGGTWICMIIAYLKDSNDGAEGGAVKYAYGRPGTDANINMITDYQSGSAGENMPTFDGTSEYVFGWSREGALSHDGEISTAHIKSISSMPSDEDIQTRYDNIVAGTGVGGGGPLIGGTLINGNANQLIGNS